MFGTGFGLLFPGLNISTPNAFALLFAGSYSISSTLSISPYIVVGFVRLTLPLYPDGPPIFDRV